MRLALSLTALALWVALGHAEDKKVEFDATKLTGEWTFVSGTKRGEKVEGPSLEGKISFGKGELKMPGPDGHALTVSFKIDAKQSPATIELEIKDGQFAGSKASGIVEFRGEQLHLLYVPQFGDAGKPPSKFESTADNGAFYFVLKRVEKK